MEVMESVLEKRVREQAQIDDMQFDFMKAFDCVPREVLRWAMRKSGVEGVACEDCDSTVLGGQDGYDYRGKCQSFGVKVGVDQGWVYIKPIGVPVNNECGIKGDQSRTAMGYALCG